MTELIILFRWKYEDLLFAWVFGYIIFLYNATKNRAIHLTCRRDISVKFVQIWEICQKAFDRICYDRETGKIIDERIYYLNYNEKTKLYIFQIKVINGAISYLINFAINFLDESIKMVGRYVFSVCSCVLDDLHKKEIDYVTLLSSVIINKTYSFRTGLHHG